MKLVSTDEAAGSALLLLIAGALSSILMPWDALLVHFFYFAIPMVILFGLAYLTSNGDGWLKGCSVGFASVSVLETFWEQYIYTGSNSMPGFVYLFLCVPLAILGLLVACFVRKWLTSNEMRTTVSAAAVFFTGGLPVFSSLIFG